MSRRHRQKNVFLLGEKYIQEYLIYHYIYPHPRAFFTFIHPSGIPWREPTGHAAAAADPCPGPGWTRGSAGNPLMDPDADANPCLGFGLAPRAPAQSTCLGAAAAGAPMAAPVWSCWPQGGLSCPGAESGG